MKKYPRMKDHELDGVKYSELDIRGLVTTRTAGAIYRSLFFEEHLIDSCRDFVVTKTDLIDFLKDGFHVRQLGKKGVKELESLLGFKIDMFMDHGKHFIKAAESIDLGAAVPDDSQAATDLEMILIRHPSGRHSQAYLYKPEKLILFGGMTEDLFLSLGYEYAEKSPEKILEEVRKKANDK